MTQPREPLATITFVDNYCAAYQDLFSDVRSFEAFKWLHLGMIADIPRKSLPAIARAVGLENEQGLLHFITESPWVVDEIRRRRLALISGILQDSSITLIIDETGDKKKGNSTDYVDRQYIGNLGKVENGIVSVNAYGLLGHIVFPLIFKLYKPKKRLKEKDTYKSKPQLAAEIIEELQKLGFKFNLVLADSLYGESETFISTLNHYKLEFIVAIRGNHGVLMLPGQKLRYNKWRPFQRVFSNQKQELRYIREIVFGKRRRLRYWQITTDCEQVPDNATWFIMSNLSQVTPSIVGNNYGLRTWIEYGFKQCKNYLGWADFRVTDSAQIERWWEIVQSAYLMVSLQFQGVNPSFNPSHDSSEEALLEKFEQHPWWSHSNGWKHRLKNLQLILQPYIFYCLIKPWLKVFNCWHLQVGFHWLITIMNEFIGFVPMAVKNQAWYFSSA